MAFQYGNWFFLNANDGLFASNQLERLQREFIVLTGIFNWVGLRKNRQKTVSMDCQPCHLPGRMTVEAYERQTTGTEPTFRERWRRRVICPECGVEITAGLLLTYRQIQHSEGQGNQGGLPPPPPPPPHPREALVPSRGVPVWRFKLDQPTGSLCETP